MQTTLTPYMTYLFIEKDGKKLCVSMLPYFFLFCKLLDFIFEPCVEYSTLLFTIRTPLLLLSLEYRKIRSPHRREPESCFLHHIRYIYSFFLVQNPSISSRTELFGLGMYDRIEDIMILSLIDFWISLNISCSPEEIQYRNSSYFPFIIEVYRSTLDTESNLSDTIHISVTATWVESIESGYHGIDWKILIPFWMF